MLKPKISVIGCGYWGKNLVRNFNSLGALHSIVDDNIENAKLMSGTHGVPILDFDSVLNSDVDGVVISTPAATHYALAKRAMLANKNVFVEKPLSLNLNEAEELCRLAEERKLTLMVGHLLQYHPAFIRLKELATKGKLGKLQYIYSNRLNLGKFRTEENILWSFAPHDMSMILALVGEEPSEVKAMGASYLSEGVHDVTTTHLAFPGGVHAHIHVSWLHPYKEQKLVVVGEKGMAVFDDGQDWGEKLKLYPHKINWKDGIPTPEKADFTLEPLPISEPLKIECQHFIDSIANKTRPITDGREGLAVLSVLSRAQEALSAAKADSVELPYFAHTTATIDEGVSIGSGTKIWHHAHILGGVTIGQKCNIGQNVMIGPDVIVGNNCKIQNNVSLYKGVTLEDDVFCGPSCVFTNVRTPRSEYNRRNEFSTTKVGKGATIGANATIVCGNTIGTYALIGAGAVVTKDVKPHALVVGNPAKQIGWVSHAGERLGDDLVCPREKRTYKITPEGQLFEAKEDSPRLEGKKERK